MDIAFAIETHYWARYNPKGNPERRPFNQEQGATYEFLWYDGYCRADALELVNRWNREALSWAGAHRYWLDP